MIINGTDIITTLGWIPTNPRELPSLPGQRHQVLNIPGAIGGIRVGGTVPEGRIVAPGYLKGTTPADLRTKADTLAGLLAGELVLRFPDYADREWVGWLAEAAGLDMIGPNFIATHAAVRLAFALPNPTARAQALTTGSGASVALNLGTAPSALRITITNGATAAITRVIARIRDGGAAGTILRELQWDGNLATGNALVIDADPFTVTNNGANALAGLTPASEFPIADPREGADHLEVVVTGGGGHTIGRAYHRRWF